MTGIGLAEAGALLVGGLLGLGIGYRLGVKRGIEIGQAQAATEAAHLVRDAIGRNGEGRR